MLVAWVRGTDGNLFLLRKSTTFKVTFEESIHKRHSIGTCWRPRDSIKQQTS